MEENKKLYSNREITIATFFGGPLAAGYLMKKNFQVMGDFEKADKSLLIGIISTIIIFGSILSLSDSVINHIPKPLIPGIYTAIISWIVNKLQGPYIKEYKENGGLYYSGWKAAGVGAVTMLILIAAIAIVAFFVGDIVNVVKSDFDTVGYNKEVAMFNANESKSTEVFKVLSTADTSYVKGEFEKSLELWNRNKNIAKSLDSYRHLPKDFHAKNLSLMRYCDLRIQQCELFIKSISEDTNSYMPDINRNGEEIDKILKELQ